MVSSKTIAYIKQDASKEEIYAAYIKSQHKLKQLRFSEKKHKDFVKKIRTQKNERYNKLKYQVMCRDQKVYMLKIYINRLLAHIQRGKNEAKEKGIILGKGKIRTKDYSIVKMHNFLTQVDNVSSILGMKLSYCSFVLWAGRYTFFTRKDFIEDNPNANSSFYSVMHNLRKSDLVEAVASDKAIKRFALTGKGVDMFNKIDRFTKKQFSNNE